MTPFRAPGEIPACSRCGVRLEPAAAQRDQEGRPICGPCNARVHGALQDRRAMGIYLPIVFGFSLLLVLMVFLVIGLAIYRASH